ncbi:MULTISPECIES: cell division protein ZipA [unclassified Avibacterium]|uniref:cell division protein ZipA n=1 Tax=unclassified Avibacterium TaxID=2685287 RepID=UPI0020265045|nr:MULTISPECIES: cell division protein ZipA [unclassified Avibacterium]MCW9717876.1 cell division protein ZipA [Avibacterium sp. 21-599]URL06998.1 cell division protein ZipA [Avibacterium sp. 21-595]
MDLNTILIILGVIALIVLVAHGIWSNRREKSQIFENGNTFSKDYRVRQPQENINQHIQNENASQSVPENLQPAQQHLDFEAEQYTFSTPQREESQNVEQAINQIKISLPNEPEPIQASVEPVVNYQTPQHLATATISEIEATLNTDEGIHAEHKLSEVLASASETHLQIERERPTIEFEEVAENTPTPQVEEEQTTQAADFLMLYVVSPENRDFNGAELAKVLDDLGFLFGHQQIYHRHLDLSVASPVLFSAANIQQPGTFDPNNMADFYTVGIALFMQLPSHGNDLVNLRMMIRAAKTIAEELGGFVLTDKQEIFDDNAEKTYFAKVSA